MWNRVSVIRKVVVIGVFYVLVSCFQLHEEQWDTIHETAGRGTTILVTTHFMEEAEYCNRVLIMDAGRVVALDTPANLKSLSRKRSMQDVFLELVRREIETLAEDPRERHDN